MVGQLVKEINLRSKSVMLNPAQVSFTKLVGNHIINTVRFVLNGSYFEFQIEVNAS